MCCNLAVSRLVVLHDGAGIELWRGGCGYAVTQGGTEAGLSHDATVELHRDAGVSI